MSVETQITPTEILSGATVAEAIKSEVAAEVVRLSAEHNFRPCLAAVRVGEDPASKVYVGNKVKTSEELGLISEYHHLPETVSREQLLATVQQLNGRDDVDGILVQLPLPKHIVADEILEAVDPAKDVDGFHPLNVGRLALGQAGLQPCTPAGVIEMLKRYDVPLRGANAVVVGRSHIVGKPMAQMLLKENCTVTICHGQTRDLAEMTRLADVLVVAVGKVGMIGRKHIKPGATVVDVGINQVTDAGLVPDLFPAVEVEKRLGAIERRGATLIGDVNQREVLEVAGRFTPVPGGVGLLTVAMLMKNTVDAAKRRRLGTRDEGRGTR